MNGERAAEKWDDFSQHQQGKQLGVWWEAGSAIHEHINRQISGSPDVDWVNHTLRTHLQGRLPLQRCLILGCGVGHLERRLAKNNVFEQCEAYDISPKSIETAQTLAADEGITNIRYHLANVNTTTLEANSIDAIWISAAMHHFEALEHICMQMQQSLKSDGLLILYEYIGPNRFQFPTRQKQVANLCLQLLPFRYRTMGSATPSIIGRRSDRTPRLRWLASKFFDKLRDGTLLSAINYHLELRLAARRNQPFGKPTVNFPTELNVASDDPSEAVRSADIVPVLREYFEILERRDWGGNIVQFLLNGIAGNFSDEDEESQDLLRMLLAIEETLIACGEFDSDFSYIVARPLPRN